MHFITVESEIKTEKRQESEEFYTELEVAFQDGGFIPWGPLSVEKLNKYEDINTLCITDKNDLEKVKQSNGKGLVIDYDTAEKFIKLHNESDIYIDKNKHIKIYTQFIGDYIYKTIENRPSFERVLKLIELYINSDTKIYDIIKIHSNADFRSITLLSKNWTLSFLPKEIKRQITDLVIGTSSKMFSDDLIEAAQDISAKGKLEGFVEKYFSKAEKEKSENNMSR